MSIWVVCFIAVIFLMAAVALMSVGIWIRKNGRFPNIHVGKNPAMRKHGVGCVEEQDKQARYIKNPMAVQETVK